MGRQETLKLGIDCLFHPARYLSKKGYIFLISHMRSYSSLLGHILGSHPEIKGYAENHQRYRNWLDFLRLRRATYLSCNSLEGRYIFDKLLHNYCAITDRIILQKNIKIIISIREPEKTIKSIVRLFSEIEHSKYQSISDCVNYYCQRLAGIKKLVERIPGRYYFFKAERIINDTEKLLDELEAFLDLETPLKSEYKTFKYTGQQGKGDPSEFISKGSVQKDRNSYENIELSEEVLAPAIKIYNDTLNALQG